MTGRLCIEGARSLAACAHLLLWPCGHRAKSQERDADGVIIAGNPVLALLALGRLRGGAA